MRNGGFKMNFEVSKLIEKLKENLEEHKQIYDEAIEGYREKLEARLADITDRVKRGHAPDPSSIVKNLVKPTSYEKEYKDALEMLEFTCDEQITLDQSLFECYVKDNWYWTRDFLNNSVQYGSTLAAKKLND